MPSYASERGNEVRRASHGCLAEPARGGTISDEAVSVDIERLQRLTISSLARRGERFAFANGRLLPFRSRSFGAIRLNESEWRETCVDDTRKGNGGIGKRVARMGKRVPIQVVVTCGKYLARASTVKC